jgi:hypothetical protein
MFELHGARKSLLAGIFVLTGLACVQSAQAQGPTPGQNVNMVSGTKWPGGDPFLQRQNEPSIAVSTRNPLHLLAGANDYRTVDLPTSDVLPAEEAGDAWLGLFKSFDGGASWQSTLIPGFPQDKSPAGLASPMKGLSAASDPVVRAGTNGMFYYGGIAFNRGSNTGGLFLSRFIDLNNKENGDATRYPDLPTDPIRYVGTVKIDSGNAGQFIDKPWLAVDVPRPGAGTCNIQVTQSDGTIVSQTFPAGNVYMAYAMFVGGVINVRTKINFTKSSDCGVTWSKPIIMSQTYDINQGIAIAIDPTTGYVYVTWRVLDSGNDLDTLVVAKSIDGGNTFTKGMPVQALARYNPSTPLAAAFFDQGTSGTTFRTNAYPAIGVDANGQVYLAWSQRGAGPAGDARIMLATSADGVNWSTPSPVDNGTTTDDSGNVFTRGHQFMPSIAITGGKVMLAYYDMRLDHTLGFFTPSNPPLQPDPNNGGKLYKEARTPEGELPLNPGLVFTPFVDDLLLKQRRHTVDLMVAQAVPGPKPAFAPPARVSQYIFGLRAGPDVQTAPSQLQQLQENPPNLKLFAMGTEPFFGDYIDVTGLTMVPTASGGWAFNTAANPNQAPVFYTAWTTNQDVRPPLDGNWQHYTPVGNGGPSIFDPTQTKPNCVPGQEGMRNQNIYSSQVTQGLLVSSPQTLKPLSATLQRSFVVLVQNLTNFDKTFHLNIANQPPDGFASFVAGTNVPSLIPPSPVVKDLDVAIPPHSGITRPVFAVSSSVGASITVNVAETTPPPGINSGLASFVVFNGDPTSPLKLINPDGVAGGDIGTIELYSPSTTDPTIFNPNAPNPNAPNPNGPNTGLSNPNAPNPNAPNPNAPNPNAPNPNAPNPNAPNSDLANPNAPNPNAPNSVVANPNAPNPNAPNPNAPNPNAPNTNITNTAIFDAVYTVTNNGNTTGSYRVKLVGNNSGNFPLQLSVNKTYQTPTSSTYLTPTGATSCQLTTENHNNVPALINNPPIVSPTNLNDPGIQDPSSGNTTFSLFPGEAAVIVLRGYFASYTDPTKAFADFKSLITQTAPVVVPQAANTNSNTIVISAPMFITTSALPDAIVGTPYTTMLSAIGGTPPYAWSTPSGGLSSSALNPTTGVISFTPAITGLVNFVAQVTDSSNPQRIATRSLTIRLVSPLTVATTSLPPAVQGSNYSNTVSSVGGVPPVIWNFSGGSPSGLNFNSNGTINGTAAGPGTFSVQATAIDSSSPPQTASTTLPLTIFANTGFISFVQQPTQTAAGSAITPAVTVQLRDAQGGVVPGVLVTIAIGNNTGGGTLSGTTTVISDQVGIATFSNLSINAPGAGYTLVASAPSGAGGTASNVFSIVLAPATALTAAVAPSSIILNWNPSTSPQVGGYNVYRSTVSGAGFTKLSTVNGSTFTDGTIAPGQTYFYVVTALGLNNVESVFSNEAIAVVPSGAVVFFGQAIDPSGDAVGGGTNPDLVWGSVTVFNGATVRLSARYASGTFNSSNTQAFFLLDTDQAVNTGSPGADPVCSAPDNNLIGVDYVVSLQAGLGLNPVANQATIFKATGGCNLFAQVGTATVAIFTDGMDVTFPLSLLTNTPGPGVSGPATTGPWNFKVLAQFAIPGVGLSGITDTMPNAGVAPASTASSPLPITPPSGMLAWWPADGYPSDIQTGHGMVISNGVSFSPDEVGQSFAFDGLTGFITVTDNGDLRPAAVTVDFWFKSNINLPDPNHPEVPLIMKLNPFDDANVASKGYDFFYQFGAIGFGLPSTPAGLRTIVSSTGSTAIAGGTWHHVAGTYDSTGQKLYLDGSLVASGPNFGPIQYQPAALQFGTVFNTADFSPSVNNPNHTYFFNGQMDEIEIHNRALSASEIQAIFNAGSVGKLKP